MYKYNTIINMSEIVDLTLRSAEWSVGLVGIRLQRHVYRN